MERTYRHTITTIDGEEKEITCNRLSLRHGLRLQAIDPAAMTETLIDMVAPGMLDDISVDSFVELVDKIMEVESGFFDQLKKVKEGKSAKKGKKGK